MIPICGTPFLFVLSKIGGACSFLDKPKSIRLFEKIPLLQDEAAAVSTTKLMIPAANGIPINANNLTKGLSSGLICVQGMIDIITAKAPT